MQKLTIQALLFNGVKTQQIEQAIRLEEAIKAQVKARRELSRAQDDMEEFMFHCEEAGKQMLPIKTVAVER